MWELDYKESWAPKNWCFWTVVLENTLESPLDCEEIKPVNPKGNQSWIFIGRTDAEAEIPTLWSPDGNSSSEKTLMMGKIEGSRRRGGQRMRWLDGIADSMNMSLSRSWSWWWTGKPGMLQSIGSQSQTHNWVTELNWELVEDRGAWNTIVYKVRKSQTQLSNWFTQATKQHSAAFFHHNPLPFHVCHGM